MELLDVAAEAARVGGADLGGPKIGDSVDSVLSAALPESLGLGLAETSFTQGTAPPNAVAWKGSVARSLVDSVLSAALP